MEGLVHVEGGGERVLRDAGCDAAVCCGGGDAAALCFEVLKEGEGVEWGGGGLGGARGGGGGVGWCVA